MKLRRPALPEDVRSALDLRPKERILAWTDDGEGRAVVASETALHVQRTPPAYTRIGWEQIENASYERGMLRIVLGPEAGSVTLRVPVGEGRDLPVVVRDRVTSSVVIDRYVPLDDEHGVRVIGRRNSAGNVTWRADVDDLIADDERYQRLADEVLDEVRSEVSGG